MSKICTVLYKSTYTPKQIHHTLVTPEILTLNKEEVQFIYKL